MRDEFWEIMDDFLPLVSVMLAITVVLLVLLVLTLPFQEPGTGSYYISMMALVILLVTLAAMFYLIRKTRAYTRE